ncbi:unnamed protein product, partial [Medioppia subpectinata]
MVAMFERSKSFVDEDPYAVPTQPNGGERVAKNGGKQGSEKARPPRLPPRDGMGRKKHAIDLPQPDYEVDSENNFTAQTKTITDRKFEDPYYCGFKARVPNFAKQAKQRSTTAATTTTTTTTTGQ